MRYAYAYGYFAPDSPNCGRLLWDVNHDGKAEDLTAYMNDAVAAVRGGRGAP